MNLLKQHNWNLFELSLIGIVTAIGIYFFYIAASSGDLLWPAVDLVAAFCGICSVVLCAKGKRSGFIFGLINVVGYSFISFNNQYYGEVMLNTLFYIPSNILSYILWSKHKDASRDNKEVKGRALTIPQLIIACIVIAVVTIGYHFVLKAMGGAMTMLDGASTILSIFATILMMLRYSEQWFFWIIVDAITVILWAIAGDPVMIAMWFAYLINAIYGYLLWLYKCGKKVPFENLIKLAAN